MKIKVKVKDKYGQPRIYPACEKAKAFLRLTGNARKCLSKQDIAIIESLGYEVEVQAPTI